MEELSEAAGTESLSSLASSSSLSSLSSSSSSSLSSSSCYSGDGDDQTVDHPLPRLNSEKWRHAKSVKCNFRRPSLIRGTKVERSGAEPTERKSRRRPEPLSRHRRKRATARDRSMAQEMNSAFEALRRAVPQDPQLPSCCGEDVADKSTKIRTLRLALRYIAQLRVLLGYEDSAAEAEQMLPHPSKSDAYLCSFSTCSSSPTLSSLSSESVFLPSETSTAAELSCDSTDLHSNEFQASNPTQSEHFTSSP